MICLTYKNKNGYNVPVLDGNKIKSFKNEMEARSWAYIYMGDNWIVRKIVPFCRWCKKNINFKLLVGAEEIALSEFFISNICDLCQDDFFEKTKGIEPKDLRGREKI